jgi:Domain of unknown function (DUF5597)/Beta-galactosidase
MKLRRNVWVIGALFLLTSLNTTSLARGQAAPPIPRIEHSGSQYRFIVDGKQFLMLGGQAHNSSASNPKDLEPVYNSLQGIHANTAEVPLYWELIEPQPGQFDFHLIDAAIEGARVHNLRLVFLWFASWKNGEMHYSPEWVKRDTKKFARVVNAVGQPTDILSPLCAACRDADANAFAKVMDHIKSYDENRRTVIMMQVENETGLLGTDRDYSDEATQAFHRPVPAELLSYIAAHEASLSPYLARAWKAGRKAGAWSDVFGELAAEVFSAWHIARYVDAVTAAGVKVYPLPMYVNNWIVNPGNERAGRWPSGGPTRNVLDIWKAGAPHIDLLAPDIYNPYFESVCEDFTRPDNPLFVPETRFSKSYAAYAYLAFAKFNAIGFSPFGIDGAVVDGKVTPRAAPLEDTYRVLELLLPLIQKNQYAGKLHAIVQNVDGKEAIPLGYELAAVVYTNDPYTLDGPWGRGIIIELAPDDFIVAGTGFRLDFRELTGPPRDARLLSIDEGTFENGEWKTERRLNGDEQHVRFSDKGRILRVRLIRP